MLIIVYPLTPPRSSPHPHPLKSTFEKFIPQFSYVPGRVEASETAGRVVDTAYTVSLFMKLTFWREQTEKNVGTGRKKY